MPVYNGGEEIVENVDVIRRAVIADGSATRTSRSIVVSDGSIDGTAERLLEARGDLGVRVIHYDRNLGKGYAVKAGALAAHGEWVALIDADLDLDPASMPSYLERRAAREARLRDRLEAASGVASCHYPRSRRIASWCYQQLNRLLFRLDVRDTQVGLKVFSRRVVDEVVPLLLVKQFAFDLELLAVADSARVRRVIRRCRFGSSTASPARRRLDRGRSRALWDTAAVFYRLRILRTYQRKAALLGPRRAPPRRARRSSA